MRRTGLLVAVSAVLLLGTSGLSASALDLGVGGTTISVPTGTDGTDGGATIGGGNGNVATVTGGSSGNSGTLDIGTGPGQLAKADQGSGSTKGTVRLGGVTGDTVDLSSVLGGSGSGSGGKVATPAQILSALGSLSGDEQQALRLRCRTILANPGAYATSQVAVCRLILGS